MQDEAWAALKQLKRGSKEIVELAGKAEKLAKQLHPRDEEAAKRPAIDAFLSALDLPLAAEVQKLGCSTMEDMVTATRRIERILGEQSNSKMERLIFSMRDQIRILTKDHKSAHEQMANQSVSTTPTSALEARPPMAVAAAQPSPLAQPPPMAVAQPPPAAPLPPLATSQPPSYPPARHLYQDYGEEEPYYRPPRFLCVFEGHYVSHFPARAVLQHLLQQQPRETVRGPPRGQVLELPTEDDSHSSTQGNLNC